MRDLFFRSTASMAAGLSLGLLARPAAAQPATQQDAAPAAQENPVPVRPGLFEQEKLLGTVGGLRPLLDGYGISLGLTETDEVLGSVSGGVRTGITYEGLTTMSLDVDMAKLAGIAGGTVRVSAFQIHGRGLTTEVGSLNEISGIEATPATRLFELWYQQAFAGGRVDVRVGQQSADLEFMTSSYAGLFINSNFGWPTSFAADLPAGGPADPLAALAVRLRVKPAEPWTVMLAVFNGSPSAPGPGNPQGALNPSGTSFRLNDGVFVIGEVQYALNGGDNSAGLPGSYKAGGWYNSEAFADQYDLTLGAARPRRIRGDWAVYAVADQLVWRPAGAKDAGVGVFARASVSPGDRNLVDGFVDAGVTYKGVFGRGDDTVGLGFGWARIGGAAREADAALGLPVRSAEWVIEATYQAQVLPAIQVQPVFQYVIHPGGGAVDPANPAKRLGNAAIFGARSTLTF